MSKELSFFLKFPELIEKINIFFFLKNFAKSTTNT